MSKKVWKSVHLMEEWLDENVSCKSSEKEKGEISDNENGDLTLW